jgi:hypothetical protein
MLTALTHTSVTTLTSRHALEWGEKKKNCGGDSWRGGLFMKQQQKWVKPVFLLGCYGCIFHGTGNSAQLYQNFEIWGGGSNPPNPLGTPLHPSIYITIILVIVAVPIGPWAHSNLRHKVPSSDSYPFFIMLMQEWNCEVAIPLIELLVHTTAVTAWIYHCFIYTYI